jgi:hypothetical protein
MEEEGNKGVEGKGSLVVLILAWLSQAGEKPFSFMRFVL